MRKKIVAGNWKMNKGFSDAEDLLFEIAELLDDYEGDTEVVICPPFVFLELATDAAEEADFKVGAQNLSSFDSGAYTGEVSAEMLVSMDVSHCIIGHSERRKYFMETDELIGRKTIQALKNGLTPIVCCGELQSEREKGIHFEVVGKQLAESLFHLDAADFSKVVIAYEPVWAIGTGLNASPEQAQEMHAFIREQIGKRYDKIISDSCSILYGGSCNAKNAASLFSQPDVDGGLIGGASLKAEEFLDILKSMK